MIVIVAGGVGVIVLYILAYTIGQVIGSWISDMFS
jgi:hypothetical protein